MQYWSAAQVMFLAGHVPLSHMTLGLVPATAPEFGPEAPVFAVMSVVEQKPKPTCPTPLCGFRLLEVLTRHASLQDFLTAAALDLSYV